jgi:hypothetical protein
MPRGGARAGAGRKKVAGPVDFRRLMENDDADSALRIKAALEVERLERQARLEREFPPLGRLFEKDLGGGD